MVVRERKAPRDDARPCSAATSPARAPGRAGVPRRAARDAASGERGSTWPTGSSIRTNPLTARVTVNRWGQYFGTGLVETENDFGTQGTPPTHPELLDWLASRVRGPRLDGEGDAPADRHVGDLPAVVEGPAGPRTRRCPQPAAGPADRGCAWTPRWSATSPWPPAACCRRRSAGRASSRRSRTACTRFTQVDKDWKASDGRGPLPPRHVHVLLAVGPAPAWSPSTPPTRRSTCTRRNRSNTPLQALTLLNDAGFFEFAQGLAARIATRGGRRRHRELKYAFRLCLAREPNERELSRLQSFLARQQTDAERPGRTKRRSCRRRADRARAWMMVARVLLNLDEFDHDGNDANEWTLP